MLSHPIFQEDVLLEPIPGNIRKAEHFLPFLRKLIVYFKKIMSTKEVQILSPLSIVYELQKDYMIEQRSLKFTHKRFCCLLNTLKVTNTSEFSDLNLVANLATMLSTFFKGFAVIIEPQQKDP
jgi:DNA excision repair protein ERCC-2